MKQIALQKTLYVLGAIMGFCLSSILLVLFCFAVNARWDFGGALPGLLPAVAFALDVYCAGKAWYYCRYARILRGQGTAREKKEAVTYFYREGLLDREALEAAQAEVGE